MKIFKRVFVVALAVAAVSVFSSCAKKNSRIAPDGTITLVVWESTNGPDEFIKEAGRIYEKTHPKIKIKFVNVELGD
ncbi:MAG: maltose ABC transporter substrate-binding protein, partial [Treponema sp.]|nr:maltose ABC transporter substrate-binding protein [Treponema sp.]